MPVANPSSITRKWLDVPYASVSPAQKLDIYLPNRGRKSFPVIVSIHGGAYLGGDKIGPDLDAALNGLRRGYAVASINYRLSGEALYPAQINDVKAAIRYLRANAASYNLDPDRFAAWGGSAGGSLSALAGTAGDVAELQDATLGNAGVSDRLQAVVDWFGPINFLTMDEQFRQSGIKGMLHNVEDSPESLLLGQLITEVPERVRLINPETFITTSDPPFFIQHGTADPLIPYQQSVEFAIKLEKVLGSAKVTLELLLGAGHGDANFYTPANIKKVLDFLDRTIGS